MGRTLWPMPGGADKYLSSLERLIDMVSGTSDTDVVLDSVMTAFDLRSRKAARSYLRVLHTLGFIELAGPSVHLTRVGTRYAKTHNGVLVRKALLERVAGTKELLAAVRTRPLRMAAAAEHMRTLGYDWSTQSQVRYRLRWLEAVGEVERSGKARPAYRVPGRSV